MFYKRTTVSVLFILLIAEVFHHCSAEDDLQPSSISVDQPPSADGLRFFPPIPFGNLTPSMMMQQLSTANITENIPKYTDSFVQAIKTLIESVNQIRQAMGLDENGQSVEQ